MSVVVAAAAGTALDPVTRAWVAKAAAYARFAGPDGDGTEIGDRCGLGHALLRAIRSEPLQPLTLDGRVWLTSDVRLDNRAGLIVAIRGRGHDADTDLSDAALLLKAYAAWGEQFLDHVAGDFAFALWDGRRQRLLCACDQIGVVPLHYAEVANQVLVASSPELLLLHPAVPDRLDEEALAVFVLTGRSGDFGSTAFERIRRLPPAHFLSWSDGQLRLRRYWRAPEFEQLLRFRRPEDYVARFRHLLELAVGDRIPPAPLVAQLSGGMDSTTMTAVAHHLRASNPSAGELRAVTGVLGGSTGDEEGHYAGLVAEALGIPLDLIDESTLESNDPFAEPKLLTPEPTPYQWSDAQYQILSVAAQRARICLSGLGADPLLGFVPWYWAEWLGQGRVWRLAVTFADQARLFGERPHPHLRESADHVLRSRTEPSAATPDWLDKEFAARTGASEQMQILSRPPAWTRDKRSLSRDAIWQTWFTWGDPSYTRLALRMRHPFTDIRLLDFAARVSPYPWFVSKRILREATADLLPEVVRGRPKTMLVQAPRPSVTPAAQQALAELVETVPETAQFFDRRALVAAIVAPAAASGDYWLLASPLGLLYWMAHWKRPRVVSDGVCGRARL